MEQLARPGTVDRVRLFLFVATGAALPLFAFPPFSLAGRPVDAATVFAALFVAASLPAARRLTRPVLALALVSAALPLARLIRPWLPLFSLSEFTVSYSHWLLLVAFFAAATTLPGGLRERRTIVGVTVFVGALVAAFALYQVLGIPRGWPGTGPVLFSFQRDPLRFSQVGTTGYFRPTSVFLETAWLGGYLVFVLAIIAGVPAAGWKKGSVFWRGALAAILVVVVLATVSWGAYVDLAAGGVVLFAAAAGRRESRKRLAIGAAVVVVLLAAGLLSPPGRKVRAAVAERWDLLVRTPLATDEAAAGGQVDSTWIRVRNVRHSVEIIRSHPARGVGLGQFHRYRLDQAPYLVGLATRDPWCGWIAAAAEMGLAGPLTLLVPIGIVLARYRRAAPALRAPAVVSIAALAAVEQLHTGSYLDLWWWYPLAVAVVLAGEPLRGLRPATISEET